MRSSLLRRPTQKRQRSTATRSGTFTRPLAHSQTVKSETPRASARGACQCGPNSASPASFRSAVVNVAASPKDAGDQLGAPPGNDRGAA